VQRVLAELRRLAQREEKTATKQQTVEPERSELDLLRARRVAAN
jgi:hypothetical protein